MFCSECGSQLSENASFCPVCGTRIFNVDVRSEAANPRRESLQESTDYPKEGVSGSREEYVGKVQKCPNCGEILGAYQAYCPSCGFDLLNRHVSEAMRSFSRDMQELLTRDNEDSEHGNSTLNNQVTLIKNFAIPNNKEDLFDFMLLAQASINDACGADEDDKADPLIRAWYLKAGQVLQKSKLLLKQEDYSRLVGIYDEIQSAMDARINRLLIRNSIGLLVSVALCVTSAVLRACGVNSSLLELVGAIVLIVGVRATANSEARWRGLLVGLIAIIAVYAISQIASAAGQNTSVWQLASIISLCVALITYLLKSARRRAAR